MSGIFFGHRGAAGEAPENTLSGFAYARQAGVQAFELDVRLSADGVPMVLHDDSLARTTGLASSVGRLTAVELAQLDARQSWPGWPDPAPIPALATVLTMYLDLPAWQIEIKADTAQRLELACELVAGQIAALGLAERVVVTSFEPLALELLRRKAPHLRRGFIARYDRPDDLATALALGCRTACIPLATGSRALVREAQSRGLHVTGWLGNTIPGLERLLAWQVDSITGDYPSLAIPFLRQQGFLT